MMLRPVCLPAETEASHLRTNSAEHAKAPIKAKSLLNIDVLLNIAHGAEGGSYRALTQTSSDLRTALLRPASLHAALVSEGVEPRDLPSKAAPGAQSELALMLRRLTLLQDMVEKKHRYIKDQNIALPIPDGRDRNSGTYLMQKRALYVGQAGDSSYFWERIPPVVSVLDIFGPGALCWTRPKNLEFCSQFFSATRLGDWIAFARKCNGAIQAFDIYDFTKVEGEGASAFFKPNCTVSAKFACAKACADGSIINMSVRSESEFPKIVRIKLLADGPVIQEFIARDMNLNSCYHNFSTDGSMFATLSRDWGSCKFYDLNRREVVSEIAYESLVNPLDSYNLEAAKSSGYPVSYWAADGRSYLFGRGTKAHVINIFTANGEASALEVHNLVKGENEIVGTYVISGDIFEMKNPLEETRSSKNYEGVRLAKNLYLCASSKDLSVVSSDPEPQKEMSNHLHLF